MEEWGLVFQKKISLYGDNETYLELYLHISIILPFNKKMQ